MTAIEYLLDQLKHLRAAAIAGDEKAMVEFAKMTLGGWHTIQHALEELNRRRIA